MENKNILTIKNRDNEKFLRKKAQELKLLSGKEWAVNGEVIKPRDLNDLIVKMRKIMREANGVGLSANQIGLNEQLFVAQIPDGHGGQKFYAIFNPKIEKVSKETVIFEEGCLSVPETYGKVERPEKITLSGFDKNGRPVKIKAWGFLARVFQHEVDHLNGKLFIDRTKEVYKIEHQHKLDH